MEIILGSSFILIGLIIGLIVNCICKEANTYRLWKGDLEKILAYTDRFAFGLISFGVAVLVGMYLGGV